MFSVDPENSECWRVTEDLVNNTTRTLVIPRAFFAGPQNIGGQYTVFRNYGIVILGWSVNFSGASASTVTLHSRDEWISAATEGTVDDPIFRWRTVSTGQIVDSGQCFIALSQGGFRSGVSPAQSDGADIVVEVSNTTVVGSLTLWGIHTQTNFGRYSETSSPADFTATLT